jgi:nucleotide-binding universal stress UspA family protein
MDRGDRDMSLKDLLLCLDDRVAADIAIDLLVMGAYGRSRFGEIILGGVTRHMLQHMTVPVLMSH